MSFVTQNKVSAEPLKKHFDCQSCFSFYTCISESPTWLSDVNEHRCTIGHVSCDRGSWPDGGLLCSSRPVEFCQAVRQMKLHSIRPNQGCQEAPPARAAEATRAQALIALRWPVWLSCSNLFLDGGLYWGLFCI